MPTPRKILKMSYLENTRSKMNDLFLSMTPFVVYQKWMEQYTRKRDLLGYMDPGVRPIRSLISHFLTHSKLF